jgi:hypothetical protein
MVSLAISCDAVAIYMWSIYWSVKLYTDIGSECHRICICFPVSCEFTSMHVNLTNLSSLYASILIYSTRNIPRSYSICSVFFYRVDLYDVGFAMLLVRGFLGYFLEFHYDVRIRHCNVMWNCCIQLLCVTAEVLGKK